jgi:hypothetical protein
MTQKWHICNTFFVGKVLEKAVACDEIFSRCVKWLPAKADGSIPLLSQKVLLPWNKVRLRVVTFGSRVGGGSLTRPFHDARRCVDECSLWRVPFP